MRKAKCENCRRRWFFPEKAQGSSLCWFCRRSVKTRLTHVELLVCWMYPIPDEPTDAIPGSEEKILVMRDRAEKKRQVFHPLDRTRFDEL